jgi:hypothetical protein
MDYSEYATKKANGLTILVKIGNSYALSTRKFDPNTGLETTPDLQAVSITDAQAEKARLQALITNIDAFISDCTALD